MMRTARFCGSRGLVRGVWHFPTVNRQTDVKHYLPATSLEGGNKYYLKLHM